MLLSLKVINVCIVKVDLLLSVLDGQHVLVLVEGVVIRVGWKVRSGGDTGHERRGAGG